MPFGTTPTPLPTPIVFPFDADAAQPIQETWTWVTDIQTSENATESRRGLRRRPGITVRWLVTAMDDYEAGLLAGLLFSNITNRWYVPFWHCAAIVTGIAAGVYSCDALQVRVPGSGKVLVWSAPNVWDLMTVSAITSGTITLTGSTSFSHTAAPVYIVPLWVGSLTQSYSVTRAQRVASFTAEFSIDTTSTTPIAPRAAVTTFQSIELLDLHPCSGAAESTELWLQPSDHLGTGLGVTYTRPLSAAPIVARSAEWMWTTGVEIRAFIAWMHTRRGRLNPLWVPTYQEDCVLAVAAVSTDTWVDIVPCGFAAHFLAAPPRTHLVFSLDSTTLVPCTVISVSIVGGRERLALSAPIGTAVPIGRKCGFLTYARLTDDAITIAYHGYNVAVIDARFTELPLETPA